jgi:16S rRNA (guanine(966)-N(2))-methyltransferase RsmD
MSLRLSGGRRLQSPPGSTARPTSSRVRLAVMNLLAAEVPGCTWLDLCSGSGVMACEALQRGARRVVAIEQDRRIVAVARANLEAVSAGLGRWELHCREVTRWLARSAPLVPGAELGAASGAREDFDLIYADPPYAAGLYDAIAAGVAAGAWLKPGGTLIWECASDAVPGVPAGWRLRDTRRYGGTTLVLLQQV